jgi:hypothetical protein
MNDRILELADQAGADIWGDQVSAGSHFNIEKFAQLIVKECADIATINQYQSYTPGHYVLKHFGVK